jgi:hypothetical protein
MAILINDNYSLQACKPFDARYLNICTPWTSVSAVNAAIPTYRYTGLTVNIAGEEYWYKNGIADGCLIPKSLGGTITGGTNGLGYSAANICLGGRLSSNTDISSSISAVQELSFGAVKALDTFYVQGIQDVLLELTGGSAQLYLQDTIYGSVAFLTAESVSLRTSGSTAMVHLSGTTVDITGNLKLLSTPSSGSTSDAVLVWNSADKSVKRITVTTLTGNSNTVNVCNVFSTYTATTTSDFIGVSGASAIYLPQNPKPCQRISVADICGNALNDTITICGYYGLAGKLINGDPAATINTDYGSITFINNGYFWSTVAFIN